MLRGPDRRGGGWWLALVCGWAGSAPAAHVEEITVIGQGLPGFDVHVVDPGVAAEGAADAAALMAQVPGGAAAGNGALAGQTQYRGLSGPRMNVQLGGVAVFSGGPNWMDPPLHYAPPALLEHFEAVRGIAPVSAGAGIGGHVRAALKSSRFGDGSGFTPQADLSLRGHTADDGYDLGALFGLANDRYRLHLLGSRDEGDDLAAGRGTVAASSYERDFWGAGWGWRAGGHEIALDFQHTDTGNAGNPVLPLDTALIDTERAQARYDGRFGGVSLEARLHGTDVAHRMDNFSLRPPPDFSSLPLAPFIGTDRRRVDVRAEGWGFGLAAAYGIGGGTLSAGFDGRFERHEAVVLDPDVPAFFIDNFNDAESDRYGAFVQWTGELAAGWHLEAGLRYERVETDAGRIDAQPARLADAMPALCAGVVPPPPPCAVRILRDRFNATDRARADDNLDWVVQLAWHARADTRLLLGVARKTRAPSYIERYLWIPLEVNAGLGDGNNYVGDAALEPEVAHQVELGLDWRTERAWFSPRAFWQRIDDYIQGVPVPMSPFNMPVIGVSANANGDPTPLAFANVEAELFGVDAGFGMRLPGAWRADAVFSWTRGRRRDIDDDLYRLAPPSLRIALTYDRPRWFAALAADLVARQDALSRTQTFDPANGNNRFAEVPGHALLHLRGQYRWPQSGLVLAAGVHNLLDKHYTDPLAGFNRVIGADVPVGQRLPGAGRNVYARLSWRW